MDDKPFVYAGGLTNAALYLALVTFAAVMSHNHQGAVCGLLSTGLAVFCYQAAAFDKRGVALMLYVTSNILAVAAGVSLVIGWWKG